MTQDLEGMGFTVVPFGQGYASMSPPTKAFYKLLMEGRIQHGGNPVMRWMAGNVVVDTDPAGNIKWTRQDSLRRLTALWPRSWRLTAASDTRTRTPAASMMTWTTGRLCFYRKSRHYRRLSLFKGKGFISKDGHPVSLAIQEADDENDLCSLFNDIKGHVIVGDDQSDSPSGKDRIVDSLELFRHESKAADCFFYSIPYAYVEVIREAKGTDKMESKSFCGPVWIQAQRVWEYFRDTIMASYTVREPGKSGVHRVFNWPP